MFLSTAIQLLSVSLLLVLFSFFIFVVYSFFFFFSSRRRHTRCLSDWSSDVCSSDLIPGTTKLKRLEENIGAVEVELTPDDLREIETAASQIEVQGDRYPEHLEQMKIGRASCRERV